MIHSKNDRGIQYRRKIKAIYYGFKYMIRHYLRYVHNGNYNYYRNQSAFISVITANYHVIEKGLAMPDFRLGFGKERVLQVIGDLLIYRKLDFDLNNVQYIAAVQSVDEYNRVHKEAKYKLDNDLQQAIDTLLNNCVIVPHNQPHTTVENFFIKTNAPFNEFALSRHSVRTYSNKNIPIDEIVQCIDLARTTPTACNRQPNKTYIITNKDLLEKIIKIQGGGRGFADKANKLLIITSRVDAFNVNEINEAFKSGGMYVMNLLYALHYKKIGACPLEWGENPKNDKTLRMLVNISDNEEIIMVISIGYPTDEFKYVTSVRNNIEESYCVID